MKINKSILTGMTALSLFATSAAAATSAVTPIVSNASAKKAVKHTYKINVLNIAKSKGHATHYYNTPTKFKENKAYMTKKGLTFSVTSGSYYGYSLNRKSVTFKLKGKRIIRTSKAFFVYTSKKHKAIKDTMFVNNGTVRISKAEFNKLNKEQMR
ncbi:hypothetical protein [Apilactobacillus kunkeei]|uniref:hypothetical protein n=1 Tax=Apilactobacillus kunkeei TaxID=148814 RepID=UPI0006CE7861|nr:hypothetical protein [Apilactobacillus kunkeei]KPN81105.1 hypothetical protein RZ77_01240 [Apilactobacillus kunkeei]MCK8629036.1 hypothetical protein [Apilactobacillus kunkeei]TPR54028.1 hypothetical protein DY036_04245 [Apilactobacillus kunkeei]CAI2700605.1 hypothetical protein AKUH4B503X_14320 [Apilactobacillus kunkeei]